MDFLNMWEANIWSGHLCVVPYTQCSSLHSVVPYTGGEARPDTAVCREGGEARQDKENEYTCLFKST